MLPQVRYGRETLKAPEGFFAKLVDSVVQNFGGFYPELKEKRDIILEVIRYRGCTFFTNIVVTNRKKDTEDPLNFQPHKQG